jgi:hypothetical protein
MMNDASTLRLLDLLILALDKTAIQLANATFLLHGCSTKHSTLKSALGRVHFPAEA